MTWTDWGLSCNTPRLNIKWVTTWTNTIVTSHLLFIWKSDMETPKPLQAIVSFGPGKTDYVMA